MYATSRGDTENTEDFATETFGKRQRAFYVALPHCRTVALRL